jgi:hypothetical protein
MARFITSSLEVTGRGSGPFVVARELLLLVSPPFLREWAEAEEAAVAATRSFSFRSLECRRPLLLVLCAW